MFLVLKGVLKIAFRDKIVELNPNEMLVITKGVEHKPIAENEVSVLLFEPSSTLNTGNINNDFTKSNLEKI
jgi:mannose-6-phosphate isomerase-like protein (cupin superfamily)